jgi:7-cyano-7-deazaguanine synthase
MNAPARPLAVVLASGGMDSAVAAAVARVDHDIALLHATYGQRTAARERRSFDALADFYRVPPERRAVLDLRFLASIGGSALTDEHIAVPDAREVLVARGVRAGEEGGAPITYVPFRNALLLSCAVAWAETLGARTIFLGAVEEDSSGYPDCREAFLGAFERAARLGSALGERLRVVAPLVHLSKAEIVRLGERLETPFELTWSCYQREDVACGRCESCVLRRRGFSLAGKPDPIPYAD